MAPKKKKFLQDGPLISVIMAVHNCEATVVSALRSITEQTCTNWELIICDDASTDQTLLRVKEFMKEENDERIILLQNKENLKLAASLDRCLDVATGELIARMDGDDLSTPDRFERQVRFLDENPEVDLVGSLMQRFNEKGLGSIVRPAELKPDKWIFTKNKGVPFCHATIIARSSVFKDVGNYTVSWRTERGQDVDLWFKFFAAEKIGRNIPEVLYLVREDETAVRRRTPKARFGAFTTRMIGSKTLGYPLSAYLLGIKGLLKILIPYKVYDLQRRIPHWNTHKLGGTRNDNRDFNNDNKKLREVTFDRLL